MKDLTVIFDMDGVIFDTERFYLDCCVPEAEKVGLEGMEEVARSCIGLTEAETESVLREHYEDDALLEKFREETFRVFRQRYEESGLPLKEGVFELLGYLRACGVKTALASSTREEVVRMELQDAGLIDYFTVIVGGDMAKHSKPEPDIFLMTADELGRDITDCIIIEDSFNGVKAAYRAGAEVFMVPDLLEPTEDIRIITDEIFTSLLDVLEYFKKHIEGDN